MSTARDWMKRDAVYLSGREPAMRMSSSLLALCCQSAPEPTWETPIRARSKSKASRSPGRSPLFPPDASETACGTPRMVPERRRSARTFRSRLRAQFAGVECGFSENADLVGAINILRAGYAQIACHVNPELGGQQQEPTSIAA